MKRQDMTAITPGTLSAEFRILSSSPAWPEVERVMLDLETGDELDPHTREQHLQILRSYSQLLRDQQHVIAQGFLCGVVVGRANGRENFADALYHGLTALRDSCGFDSSSARDVLNQVKLETRERFPALLDDIDEAPASFTETDAWREWAQSVNSAIDTDALQEPVADGSLRESAWSGWDQRLRFHLGLQEAAPRPGLVDAVCLDGNVSPANLMSHPLSEMTLRQWSLCLLAGLGRREPADASYAPVWLTAAAALELGLPGLAESALKKPVDDDAEAKAGSTDFWRKAIQSWAATSRPAILVITNEHSVCDPWRAGSLATGISLRPDELDSISGLGLSWPDPIVFVVIEHPLHDGRNIRSIEKILRDASIRVRKEQIFDLLQQPPQAKRARPFVVAPSGGIDGLYGALKEQQRELQRRQQQLR